MRRFSVIGQTISHYRIVEKLGAGGMGVVYRAEDTNLNRQVAIKVLPEMFSGDPERMARFEREAKLLASLNHPNIATIHGLEQADGKRFLVMELVEGKTLAQRIAEGPLPVDESLEVCRQIAEGLEAAHEKVIIHRDLKPANVKITPEGKVKVLDFGLAKAFHDAPAADLSRSPTLTDQMTRPGVILGTAAYMSPEQAKGKPLDKRTDIWSFGCILYECLTGRGAFTAETATETVAAILAQEPAWDLLPAAVPPQATSILRRCLRKDPRLRFHEIADVRIELDEIWEKSDSASAAVFPRTDRTSRWPVVLPWLLSCGLATVIVVGLWSPWKPQQANPRPLMRFSLLMPGSPPLAWFKIRGSLATPNYGLAISPDARFVVYLADIGATTQLYLRPLNQLAAEPIPFTEDASDPFISPDGQWVGFFARGELKKVSLQGGPPKIVCKALVNSRGGSWGEDGTIVFALVSGGLWRVSADGGTPTQITSLNPSKGEISHRLPRLLPGGKAVIFTIKTNLIDSFDDAEIAVARLDTGERHVLVEGGSCAEYAPSGHIVYAHGGSLLAVPFDRSRLAVTGPPKPVLGGVITDPSSGAAMFSSSLPGILIYAPGTNRPFEGSLIWRDKPGKLEQLAETRCYADPRLSPDGQQLAVRILAANDDIYLYEIPRHTFSRLTLGGGNYYAPVWTPDGKRLVYSSDKSGHANLYWKDADGSGAEQRLTRCDFQQIATSFSHDGKTVVFDEDSPSGGRDIWTLTMQADDKPRPFIQTVFDEYGGAVSPDGRWMAYVANDSGRDEVYVQSFPKAARRWTVSNGGGKSPIWGIEGNELFYRNGDKMMLATVTIRPTFSATSSRVVFELPPRVGQYDVARDGRFLMIQNQGQGSVDALNVIVNWFEELKRLVPAGNK